MCESPGVGDVVADDFLVEEAPTLAYVDKSTRKVRIFHLPADALREEQTLAEDDLIPESGVG